MIYLIVVSAIFGTSTYFAAKDSWDKIGAWIIGAFWFVVFMFFSTLIIAPAHQTVQAENLHAIGAGKQLSGSFFLASGSIKEKAVFYYYKEANGGLQLDSVRADAVTIVEDDSTPRITKVCHERYRNAWNPIWTYTDCNDWDLTIHVPRGSVTTSKQLDLPN